MRSLTARYPRLLAAFALLGLLAACDKDKDVEPPAELVNFKESIKVQRAWNISLGGAEDVMRVGLAPAADAERVYAAGFDGDVIAVQAATGKTVWRIKTRTQLTGGPGVGAGLVVVGGANGEVIALEQASGARRWSAQVGGEVLSAPAVATDAVIVRTVAGQLVGLAPDDGRQIWREDQQIPRLTLRGVASPVIAGNAAICGFDNGRVLSVATRNGEVFWEQLVSPARGRTELERIVDIDSAVKISGQDIFVAGFRAASRCWRSIRVRRGGRAKYRAIAASTSTKSAFTSPTPRVRFWRCVVARALICGSSRVCACAACLHLPCSASTWRWRISRATCTGSTSKPVRSWPAARRAVASAIRRSSSAIWSFSRMTKAA